LPQNIVQDIEYRCDNLLENLNSQTLITMLFHSDTLFLINVYMMLNVAPLSSKQMVLVHLQRTYMLSLCSADPPVTFLH
jgi:hypothetical protein